MQIKLNEINENIASIVRSVVIGGVCFSFLAPIGGLTESFKNRSNVELATAVRDAEPTVVYERFTELREELTEPCINWIFADNDSKLEARAEKAVNVAFEGPVDHRAVCRWILDMN